MAQRLTEGAAAAPVLDWGRNALQRAGIETLDYLELRSAEDLETLAPAERPAPLFFAGWLGAVRLMDHVAVAAGGLRRCDGPLHPTYGTTRTGVGTGQCGADPV